MKRTKWLLIGSAALVVCVNALAEDVTTLKEKALLYLPMEKDKILEMPKSGAEVKTLGDEPVFNKGKKGQGLVIDGEGISIKGLKITGSKLINGEEGTVAYWMKPLLSYTEGKSRQYFLAAREYLGDGNQGNGHYIYIISPAGGFYFQTIKDKKWISPHFNFKWWKKPQWSTELWYHIAVTWGPKADTIFYVNGVSVHKGKKGSSSVKFNAQTVYVGCSDSEKNPANALLDEFYIFGEILSQENIKLLMTDVSK
jgi:concanavalin A-like lectin/glucanase superfamily protein